MQAGILCGQRGVNRHEQGGDQEQPKYNPSLDRYTCGPLACLLVEQRRLGAKLCYVFPVHGDSLFLLGGWTRLQLPRCKVAIFLTLYTRTDHYYVYLYLIIAWF